MQNRGNHSRYPHDGVGSPRNGRNSARYRTDGTAAYGGRSRFQQSAESEYESQDQRQQTGGTTGRHVGRAAQRRAREQENAQHPASRRQEPLDDWVPIDFEGKNPRSGYGSHRKQTDDTGEWAPIDASSQRGGHRRGQDSGPFAASHGASRDAQPTQRIDAAAVNAALGGDSKHTSGSSNGRASTGGNSSRANGAVRTVPAISPDQQYYKVKKKAPKKHRGLKIAAAIIICLVVVVGAAGGALAFQVKDLRTQASSVMQDASDIQTAFGSSDYAGANQSALDLQSNAASMNRTLQSPLWAAASALPVVGSDVQNVRTLGSVLSTVADSALVPVTQTLADNPPSALAASDGSINVGAVNQVLTAVQQGAPAMRQASAQLDAMPASTQIPQLNDTVASAKQKLSEISDLYERVSDAAPILQLMIGSNGEYLVVAQNSAELRACGGFPGSMGTIKVSDGKMQLGDFAAVANTIDSIPSNLTDEEQNLFYAFPGFTFNMSFNPDYPRDAQAWCESFEHKNGRSLDGAISITPSVVQDLLAATGSTITLSDGTTLDGTNATKALEHDIYWKYLSSSAPTAKTTGNDTADALFAEAAQKAFDSTFDNIDSSSLLTIMEDLDSAASDRHIMMWFADTAKQSQISSTTLAGALDAQSGNQPTLGVFANVWIASKAGWWLGLDNSVDGVDTAADGTRTYHMTTTLQNTLTQDELANGGLYILGYETIQTGGDLNPFIYFYAPAGATIQNLSSSNGTPYAEASYKGLQVLYTPRTQSFVSNGVTYARPTNPLRMGQTVTITYDVVLPASVQGDLNVETMPTLTAYH